MNILVEGSRGKSGIVKMLVKVLSEFGLKTMGKITGKYTHVILKDKTINIERDKFGFHLDKENQPILDAFLDYDYRVFENQALSLYTMRVIHNIIKPEIIIIPNIRYEHQDKLGSTIEEQAKSFALNFKGCNMVITTELTQEVLKVFRKYATKFNVKLIEIDKPETIPTIQQLYLAEELIKQLKNVSLPKCLKHELIQNIHDNVKLNYDYKKDVYYYKGSKVNDIESTINMFNYLKQQTTMNFCFLCYLRKDRTERTEAFLPFFKNVDNDNRIKKVLVVGHNFKLPKSNKIQYLSENIDKKLIYQFCREHNLVLFTAINGVVPFMKDIEDDLK